MAEAPSIRQSRFLNQLVIDRSTTEIIGRVEQVWMDPAVHRVLGFVCKQGLWGGRRDVFALPQIHVLGEDSIVLASSPTRAALEQVRQLESLINLEVWSEAGERIGKIVDCEFNLKTGKIRRYLMTLEGFHSLTSGLYQIFPTQIVSYGEQRVLIFNVATDNLELFQPGLEQRLLDASEQLSEHLKEDYSQWSQKARQMAKRAQGKLLNWTEQATQRVHDLAEQASEWTDEWKEGVEFPFDRSQDAAAKEPSNQAEQDLGPLNDGDAWNTNPRSHPAATPAQSAPPSRGVVDTAEQADYPYDQPNQAVSSGRSANQPPTTSLFDHVMDHNPSFNHWMEDQDASAIADSPNSGNQETDAVQPEAAKPFNLKNKASEQIEDDDEPWI